MSKKGKFSPGFLISHEAGDIFPTEQERSSFSYEPLDLFLNHKLPQDSTIDPRLVLGADEADELVGNLTTDLYLVFRYKKKGFDIGSAEEILGGEEEFPGLQREFFQASIRPDSDFVALAEILSDTVGVVTDAEYMYSADPRGRGGTQRCREFGEYLEMLEGRNLKVWPETYGINEIEIKPERMLASFSLYRQEVKVHGEEPGFRKHGLDEKENYWEDIHLNYDEGEIEELERKLESEGFNVRREYLPRSVSPPDI